MLRVTTLVITAFITVQVEASYSLYSGGPGLYSNYHGEYAASYDNYVPKPYAFEYGVSDPYTGDHKNQWETKDAAGVVRGSYSLLEPDGSTRIVDYIADKGGFRAVVKRINIHGYASVESHGGAVEAPTVHGLGQIIVAEPSPVQPVALSQPEELVIKQPAVYIDQGQIFESYDGGYQNYQNLVPYQVQIPRANGIAIEQPKQEIGYAQQTVFTPQSDTIYTQQQAPYVIPVPPKIQETYQHSSNPLRNELSYQQPQQIYQDSPPVYQAPIQRYEEPQIENVAIPAYRENTPIDNYQLEMIYGAQANAYTSDSLGSQANTILHPHGQSSQTFSGSTGNLADDTVYTDYPQNNLNQAQYISSQGTYEGRYKRKS